ncbi:hypothetical protein RJT34_10984 [Clitoria ternatea]|uniref:Uncharacterized protein n=1 Tax=Clitoria ternatea TaxID=43366 RepID=A0AAN9JLU7_CLITE
MQSVKASWDRYAVKDGSVPEIQVGSIPESQDRSEGSGDSEDPTIGAERVSAGGTGSMGLGGIDMNQDSQSNP